MVRARAGSLGVRGLGPCLVAPLAGLQADAAAVLLLPPTPAPLPPAPLQQPLRQRQRLLVTLPQRREQQPPQGQPL
jgi:hypothetical protein